jgi:hypothetical protein
MAKRRPYERPRPSRNYRTLYIIATEGSETEPAYFNMFQSQRASIRIKLLPSRKKTAPSQVLQRVERHAAQEQLRPNDAVWLVLDRDCWEEAELDLVHQACFAKKFYLAVSNPCFEYWLLLHFDKGSGVTNAASCRARLVQALPTFSKNHVEVEKFRPRIDTAIDNARVKDNPPVDWPHGNGSTVYRLVEQLISMKDSLAP